MDIFINISSSSFFCHWCEIDACVKVLLSLVWNRCMCQGSSVTGVKSEVFSPFLFIACFSLQPRFLASFFIISAKSSKIQQLKHDRSADAYCFQVAGIIDWNSSPFQITSQTNFNNFKTKEIAFLLSEWTLNSNNSIVNKLKFFFSILWYCHYSVVLTICFHYICFNCSCRPFYVLHACCCLASIRVLFQLSYQV